MLCISIASLSLSAKGCSCTIQVWSYREHEVLKDWDLHAVSFAPKPRLDPPFYTYADWLVMIVLVLDGKEVIVQETTSEVSRWMRFERVSLRCLLRPVY